MSRSTTRRMLAAWACAAVAGASVAGTPPTASLPLYIQPLGSAGLATNEVMRWANFDRVVDIPEDTHEVTITYWAASRNCSAMGLGTANDWYLPMTLGTGGNSAPHATDFLPFVWYTPDHRTGAPDLLGGAFGWGGAPITVSGARSFSYGFPTIVDGWNGGQSGADAFPHGVYCVRWSDVSSPMTLTVGGEDVSITSGSGEKNVNPKDGVPGIVLTGNGTAKVGVGRIKVHEFFSTMLGDADGFNVSGIVGSNYVFVAHRVRLDANVHTGRTDIATIGGSWRRRGEGFAMPVDGSTTIHAGTFFRICYYAIGRRDLSYIYEWDYRQFPKWLDDDEIMGVYEDGARVREQFGYLPYVLTNAVHQVDP